MAAVVNQVFASRSKGVSVAAADVQLIGPADAASHIGQSVVIRGVADDVHRTRTGIVFIDMGGRYPANAVTAVIFAEDAAKFPEVGSLQGRTVEVSGVVHLYHGKPEIVLRHPDLLRSP